MFSDEAEAHTLRAEEFIWEYESRPRVQQEIHCGDGHSFPRTKQNIDKPVVRIHVLGAAANRMIDHENSDRADNRNQDAV
jgi:hypothetical protein